MTLLDPVRNSCYLFFGIAFSLIAVTSTVAVLPVVRLVVLTLACPVPDPLALLLGYRAGWYLRGDGRYRVAVP